jgi:hypothetical protein
MRLVVLLAPILHLKTAFVRRSVPRGRAGCTEGISHHANALGGGCLKRDHEGRLVGPGGVDNATPGRLEAAEQKSRSGLRADGNTLYLRGSEITTHSGEGAEHLRRRTFYLSRYSS